MCARALCVLSACALLAVAAAAPATSADELSMEGLEPRLSSLYALLARHGALDGHALARKSVRSPSRRLRFGRRSDPAVPLHPPLEEESDAWSEDMVRLARAPLRLRFGRSDGAGELLVPHVFPEDLAEDIERSLRSSAMRLRFGRSATHGPQPGPNLPNEENNGSQD